MAVYDMSVDNMYMPPDFIDGRGLPNQTKRVWMSNEELWASNFEFQLNSDLGTQINDSFYILISLIEYTVTILANRLLLNLALDNQPADWFKKLLFSK